MALIDFILNLAGLLLWLNWRSLHFERLAPATPATLAGTLKRAEPRVWKGWHFLAGLVLLLGLRALLYWNLGSAAGWTPKLNLGVVVLAFRSDSFPVTISFQATLVYSVLSFVRVLVVFYFWLLILGLLHWRTAAPDPVLKLLRLHLGRVARWRWWVQLLLPLPVATLAWMALHPLLVSLDVLNRAASAAHLAGQGLMVGAGLWLTLKYLLPPLLLLHLIASYVYLGSSPGWDFVSGTARNLLAPARWLRYAKLDFAPLFGILVIVALLHWFPNALFRELLKRNLTLWPQ